eukprot:TRINITY_DN1853_c0_g1_i3.p1 TRINITY_DN1853_c0_g1~~TRINITY_DN1853_c0_g1_i3.p1  ORF type:complete len:276 (+),score=45.19 TRINITY_DN1853_c0_g1_i3:287-1114(+)
MFMPAAKTAFQNFSNKQVTGDKLEHLTTEDLAELGFSPSDIKIILKQIGTLKKSEPLIDSNMKSEPLPSVHSPSEEIQSTPSPNETKTYTPPAKKSIPFSTILKNSVKAEHDSQIYRVLESYNDWWNQPKFRSDSGWEKPPFQYRDIYPLLFEAADILTFIREHLDAEDSTMKIRMLDGNAQALFNKTKEIKDEDAFVRDLVHHSMSDAVGYVEGMNKEIVDKYIDEVQQFRAPPSKSQTTENQQQNTVFQQVEEKLNHNNDVRSNTASIAIKET